MLQLLIRDIQTNRLYFGFIIIFPLLIAMLHFPKIPISTYSILFFIFIASPFYFESIHSVNRFNVSLPIKRSHLILSRYLFILIFSSVFLTYILVLETFFFERISTFNNITVLFFFTLMYLVIALALPIYYFFYSIWIALVCQFIIFTVGSFAIFFVIANPFVDFDPLIELVLNFVALEPFSILILFSLIALTISYKLSRFIFSRKDLA